MKRSLFLFVAALAAAAQTPTVKMTNLSRPAATGEFAWTVGSKLASPVLRFEVSALAATS